MIINVLVYRYFGGWVAPNIFYVGQSGVIRIVNSNNGKSIRIGGLSDVYKGHDYDRGNW